MKCLKKKLIYLLIHVICYNMIYVFDHSFVWVKMRSDGGVSKMSIWWHGHMDMDHYNQLQYMDVPLTWPNETGPIATMT
uniref:Uncharacterized protein n=1 Tax=Helianthus annuus TaxID=4232 RepID=A0A251VHG7_HELAN